MGAYKKMWSQSDSLDVQRTEEPMGMEEKPISLRGSVEEYLDEGEGKRKCIDKKRTSAKRRGQRYKIGLENKDAKCTDKDNRTYQYGQFEDVKTFSKCAEKCVQDVKSGMLKSFRGVDFNCKDKKCNCLYDRGALDNSKRDRTRYEKTSRNQRGRGNVKGTKKDKGTYCGKLISSEFVGFAEGEVELVGNALEN